MTSPNSPYQGDASQPENGNFQQNQYQQQPNGFAAPQQPQKKKGGCMKWGAIIVGVLVVLGIIINIAGGDSEDTSSSSSSSSDGAGVAAADADTNENAAVEADAEEGEAQSSELAPGQTYTTSKGLDITVNSVSTATDALGDTYVSANVTYVNNGDEQESFDPFTWDLQTPAGVISDFSITGFDDALGNGDLTPGGTVTGTVYFEGGEPGEYLILWEPTFSFSGDKATWKFSL